MTAHRCSLRCITRTRASANSSSGHGAPVFTSDLRALLACRESAGPLRHVAGFPDLGLLRVLRPTPAASAGDGPSHQATGCRLGSGPQGWFPRSPSDRSTGEAPSYAPAASPRLRRRPSPWPPARRHHPGQEFPAQLARGCAPQPSPHPPDSSWWFSLERRSAAGSSRTPSRLACRTRTVWQYRYVPSLSGPLPPFPASPGSGCPQLHRATATARRRRSLTSTRSHGASWRSKSTTHS